MVRRKPQVIKYAVVVETIKDGFVIAAYHNLAEAQMLAHKIVARVQIAEDIPVLTLLRCFAPIESYTMNGETTSISQAVWFEYLYSCEVYVVPIDFANGGVSQFIKERENCSSIISFNDYFDRYKRAIDSFKPFGFLAN